MASNQFAISDLTGGQLNALVKNLGGDTIVRQILSGAAKVTVEVLNHLVNGDSDPFLPDKSWKVEEHKMQGEMKITRDGDNLFVNGKKIDFYLSENQQGEKYMNGDKLRKELADKSVLNANVLDYLREHPELIPDSWKQDADGNTRYIFFWGTVYRRSVGNLYVRYLYWNDGAWFWSYRWLGSGWSSYYPAAVLAS